MLFAKPQGSSSKRRKRSSGSSVGGTRSGGSRFGETKYVDGYLDQIVVKLMSTSADSDWTGTEFNPRNLAGVYGCLPVPRTGTNFADRDGRQIYQKTIRINGEIKFTGVDGTATPASLGMVRILIVKDTRTAGELSGENVIGAGLGSDGDPTLSGNGGGLNLFTNPDGWGRYKIMADKMIRCPALPAYGDGIAATGNYSSMRVPFSFKIKCNCNVNFVSGGVGAVGSIVDNSFHVLAAANDVTGDPEITYYARTSFTG